MDRRRFILSACAVLYTTSLAGCGTDNGADKKTPDDTDDGTNANGNNTTTEDAGGDGGDGGDEVTDTNRDVITTEDVDENKDVKIVDHSIYIGEMSYGVRGVVANTGDSEVSFVEVTVEFFDAEGTTIDQGSELTTGFAASQEWEFEIREVGKEMSEVSEIDDYDIRLDVDR